MENTEAILITKNEFKEADYIITFFTKEFGKLKGIAKNAKKSQKRFGGRLEPFIHINLTLRKSTKGLSSINDVSVIKVFPKIMETLESFMVGSFILEYLNILTQEDEPNTKLFECTINTFEKLNKQILLFPTLLKFQIEALSLCGYEPSFNTGEKGKDESVFSISKGSLIEHDGTINNRDTFKLYTDIIENPELMEIYLSKVVSNIKVLTKYTEHHTSKQFKTSQFLEDLNI